MVIPTAFAYAGKLAPPGQEGRYMGIFNIALIAGFGIGPVVGGLVYDSYGMDATFTSMGILSAVGFLVVLLFLPSTSPTPHMVESDILSTPLGSSGSMTSIVRDDNMLGLVTFQLVWGLSYGAVLAFLPIFMTTIMGTSVAQVGIVLSTRSILSGTLAYPFGWLADRMNRVFLVSTGMIVMAVGVFFIPWVEAFALMLCLFITMAICESSAFPAANAITVDRGRSLGMGLTMGVFFMAMSAGLVTGSIGGGVIEGSMGVEWVFRYATIAGLVGVVIFNVFMRRGIAQRSV
jgi:DHA1 family multidrug resistance protein-like MFS transporter